MPQLRHCHKVAAAPVTFVTVISGLPESPVALPVNAPTKPPVEVVIPVTFTFAKNVASVAV